MCLSELLQEPQEELQSILLNMKTLINNFNIQNDSFAAVEDLIKKKNFF